MKTNEIKTGSGQARRGFLSILGLSIMAVRIKNLIKLFRLFKKRGNWQLIRESKGQLADFILCRSGLNKKPIFKVIPYWFFMLKSLDVLVWRLETFGFLYLSHASESDKKQLNWHLENQAKS